jgi:putative PIN family toxin of toxin-antitoxin system
MQYQDYILRIYLGPTPFQPLSLLTTVNWGATFREKLTGKFKFTPEEAEAAVALLLTRMLIVEPTSLGAPVCRDKDDDNIIAVAISGGCGCIITGDKDLLVLQRFSGIDILGPKDFLEYEATR